MLIDFALTRIDAAWACDDRGKDTTRKCSRMAVQSIINANNQEMLLFENEPGANNVVMVDLLRRAGMLKEAKLQSKRYLKQENPYQIYAILEYERKLIRRRNKAGA